MEPITNSDRLIALLRQRLRERATPLSQASSTETKKSRAATGLKALSALGAAGPHQLRRACIQALLADQLGSGLLNDAQFQQIVTRVTDVISEDPSSARLLDGVIRDARAD